MKRKAFGFLSIFLVLFQMFSPWSLILSDSKISIEENTVSAQTSQKRDFVKDINSNAFIIVTGINDTDNTINVSLFTDPNYKITNLSKIRFDRDEFDDIEAGCPATNTEVLVSNPSLANPITESFAGLDLQNTSGRGYLKQDFSFKMDIPFKAWCINDDIGFDAWGHYSFTYNVTSTNGGSSIYQETTTTGKSRENLADEIKEEIVFIKAQASVGNNFVTEWGRISGSASLLNAIGGGNMDGLTVAGLSLKGASTKYIQNTMSSENKITKNDFKIRFLQNNKELDLYSISKNDTIDSSSNPPRTGGSYELSTSTPKTSLISLIFDPIKDTGVKSTWSILTATPITNKNVFSSADYAMEDYSIRKLVPAVLPNGDPVLDIDISMLMGGKESKGFDGWLDADKDGKASSKDVPGDDWDNFTRDFGSPEIDRRPASEGNGFYLLYSSVNKNPEAGQTGTKEINLNPYIFGEKVESPIITEAKTGIVFGIDPLPVEKNKTYYFRLFARDHDSVFSDSGYTSVVSINIPDQITQASRGEATLIESGDDAGNGPSWLPNCDATSPSTWFQGCLIVGFYYLIFEPTSYLLGLAGNILDFTLIYSIEPDAYKSQYIVDGWRFIRDACNLFFIFMLIYLAFKVMLGIGQGTKQLIVNTIIVATVINFSYPLTTVVIDISNITARQLYYNAFNKQNEEGKPLGLSAAAAKGYNPQRIILEGSTQEGGAGVEKSKGSVFMVLLLGVIFNIIAIIIFLKIALQFVYRIIGLIFAIILSPLAVFSFSLSIEQRSKLKMVGFEEWINGLMVDAFKAPVFLFLIMILILFVNNNPFKGVFKENVTGIEWWMSILIPFMMIMAFFKIIESTTKSMTSSIAKMTGDAVIKGVGAVAGVAMGGVALAGAGIIGKGAGKLADSKIGQRIMDRSVNNKGLGGFIARQQVRAMRGMQGGSYDLRQTQLGNAVSRESGADFNLATRGIDRGLRAVGAGAVGLSTGMTAGGYMALGDRRNKEREEYLKLVGHDQNLEARLKEKKDAIDDKKKESESNLKDEKAKLRDEEEELRKREDIKKKADEDHNDIEKLEELLTKRKDLPSSKRNEIDLQIDRLESKITNGQGGLVGSNKAATAALGTKKTALVNAKDTAKTSVDDQKLVVKNKKDEVNKLEDDIRNLDKSLSELTKAIENVKNNRANAYAHQIRNRSGRIYRRETYREDITGAGRAYSTDQENAFSAATGGDDLREEMRNIITSVEERSNTPNNARSARVIITNTAIGAVAGAFTGGAFNAIAAGTAIGAGTGGIVGIARSYRPENESYRTAGDSARWRPNTNDGYTAPTSS